MKIKSLITCLNFPLKVIDVHRIAMPAPRAGVQIFRKIQTKKFPLIVLILVSFLLEGGCASLSKDSRNNQEYLMGSVLWVQTSGEYKALCYQAYNLAKTRLDQELQRLSKEKNKKTPAIVLDIDETIIDNSPYQAKGVLENKGFPEGWKEWVAKASATPTPGALEFLKYVESKGVMIVYVTNRKIEEEASTLANFVKYGIPFNKDGLFFRNGPSSKEGRREQITKNYEVLLLIGDNLNDFSNLFEDKSVSDRALETDKLRDEFGKKFIVLPNPMYGDWENALYKDIKSKINNNKEKDQKRREYLITR